MTDHISEDGKWKWTGSEWVPNEVTAPLQPREAQYDGPPPKKGMGKGAKITLGALGVLVALGALGAVLPDDTSTEPVAIASSATETPAEDTSAEEAAAEEAAAEEAAAEEAAAEEAAATKKSNHSTLTSREFAQLLKNPDAHIGENVIVYAEVFQFDAATGTDRFLGWIAENNIEEYNYWSSSDGAFFEGNPKKLNDVVESDIVKVWATVNGSFSYDTQAGGNTTVPDLTVNHIDVIGSTD